MADSDDLDDLLDEIEGSLTHTETTKPSINVIPPIKTRVSAEDEDMDHIIDDICNDDDPLPVTRHTSNYNKLTKRPLPNVTPRCTTLLLGGSMTEMGLSERNSQRSCDKLRCTGCDFNVLHFNDFTWHSKCDYMFFRNNMPNTDKLSKNLVRKRGSRAYSCQCSWITMETAVEVTTLPQLKWVCGRH
ncbi:cilia- and flagella-associated protein 418-like [Halichondria panicea]|uniref:cilia- and flagella-associated protein 418-like n=1 Tax=Halichondria panicea TaxID=6063 RepID=UPI00312B75C2